MATETTRVDFQSGQAWVEISYDTVALNVTSVRYQNATSLRAIVDVAQAGKPSLHTVVNPGMGVPNPVTAAVPAGRYTVSPDPNDPTGFIPDYSLQIAFRV